MALQGQCLLSVIPVRSEPKSQAEMVTQLVYGETYAILNTTSEWLEIKIDYDGYVGWISENQYSAVTFASKSLINRPYQAMNHLIVPMGAEVSDESDFQQEISPITLAESLLGSPYLWGGRTFMGIDCSGFMQVVHKAAGIALPRDASQQVHIGEIVNFGDQESGDLVFFVNQKQRVHHVGMMLNKTEIIHASGSVRVDKLSEDGIVHREKNICTHSLFQINRIR